MTNISGETVLITGAAGFIGFHLARHYHRAGMRVAGVDRMRPQNRMCRARLSELRLENIGVELGDLAESGTAAEIFARHKPGLVFHMAAHAGVRCGDREKFDRDNVLASANMLAAARRFPPAHFLFASSGSVYGEHSPRPFCEDADICMPENIYAASKYAGEMLARYWARSGNFPATCVRFFNVYGPWGRPDMMPFRFADALAEDGEVSVISGEARRAWLYIGDAVCACAALARAAPAAGETRIVNVAGPELVRTADALSLIAKLMDKKPRAVFNPPAEPEITSNPADLRLLKSLAGDVPRTPFCAGIKKFLTWRAKGGAWQ